MDPDKARAAARADEDVQRVKKRYIDPVVKQQIEEYEALVAQHEAAQASEDGLVATSGLYEPRQRPRPGVYEYFSPKRLARRVLGMGDEPPAERRIRDSGMPKTPEGRREAYFPVIEDPEAVPVPYGPEQIPQELEPVNPLATAQDIGKYLKGFYQGLYKKMRQYEPQPFGPFSVPLRMTPEEQGEFYKLQRDAFKGVGFAFVDSMDATLLQPTNWDYDEETDTGGYTKDPRIRTQLDNMLKGSKAEQIGVDALLTSAGLNPEEVRADPDTLFTDLMTGDQITAGQLLEAKAELWRDGTLSPSTMAGMVTKMMTETSLALIGITADPIDPYNKWSAAFFAVPPGTAFGSVAAYTSATKAFSIMQKIRRGELRQIQKLVKRTTLGQNEETPSALRRFSTYDGITEWTSKDDIYRRMLNLPGIRSVAPYLGASRSLNKGPIHQYAINRGVLRGEAHVFSREQLSNIDRQFWGGWKKIGIEVDDQNRLLGEGKSYHLKEETDIVREWAKYATDLPEEGKHFLRAKANLINDLAVEARRMGIDLGEIVVGLEGAYLPRRVVGKKEFATIGDSSLPLYLSREKGPNGGFKIVTALVDKNKKLDKQYGKAGSTIDAITLDPPTSKPTIRWFDRKGKNIGSGKLGVQKRRKFDTHAEAVDAGYVMARPDEAFVVTVTQLNTLMADKIATNGALLNIPHRIPRVPEHARSAMNTLKFQLSRETRQLREAQLLLKERTKVSTRTLKLIQSKAKKRVEKVNYLENNTEAGKGVTDKVFNKEVKRTQRSIKNLDKEIKRTLSQYRQDTRKRNTPAFRNVVNIQNRLNRRKKELDAALPEYRDIRRRYTEKTIDEDSVNQPGFVGRLFDIDDAAELNQVHSDQHKKANAILSHINRLNSIGRLFTLTMDAGVFMIQLILLAGRPKIMGESIVGGVRAMVDPKYIPNLYWKNRGYLNLYPRVSRVSGGHTEVTEALRQGLAGRSPGVFSKLGTKIFSPAQRLYEGAMDTAGIEMIKALDYKGVTVADREEISAHINAFRGLMDTTGLGISAQQRAVESLVLLAPRYNRAVASIALDIFKGGLRGDLAREALIRATTAGLLTAFGLSLAAGESVDEAMDHINPANRDKFMTWTIAGQKVGPGSKFLSLIRLFSAMAKQAHADPRDVMLWGVETPRRFLRGNLSPVLRTAVDLALGEDFLGYPTRDDAMDITETVILRNILPFWVHSVLMEDGPLWDVGEGEDRFKRLKGAGLRAISEGAGWRAHALTPTGKFQQLASKKEGGIAYDLITKTRQLHYKNVEPETRALWELVKADAEEREGGSRYLRALHKVKADSMLWLNKELEGITEAGASKRLIRKAFSEYQTERRILSQKAEKDFSRDKKRLETYIAANPAVEFEAQIWNEYQEIAYDEEFEPKPGEEFRGFDFQKRDEALAQWRAEVGEKSWEIIQNIISHYQKEHHPLIQELLAVRKLLQPYWAILDAELAKWGATAIYEKHRLGGVRERTALEANYPQLRMALEETRRRRNLMEATNDEVAQALLEWDYSSSVNNTSVMRRFGR